jgi:hypothetical protein
LRLWGRWRRDTAIRFGPGRVFIYEWLTSSRRWQLYALRDGFFAAILIGMIPK